MLRTTVTIDHTKFFLAQSTDVDVLEDEMIAAVRDGGGLIHFTEVGNRRVTALVTPGVGMLLGAREVAADGRDDGDLNAPFTASPHLEQGYVEYND